MKNLGRKLSKIEQKEIQGGNFGLGRILCQTDSDCYNASPLLGSGDVYCGYGIRGRRKCILN
ncbi:hypothetical protein [Tenacibaculum agarivorans]|uniref:hypothetical protein n=1 Tax=Tenacibaculum agarivorans TaxID=1908389 RepID=UPI00094B8558|nr:hypothetical protein [Tenacibaculum agarivorans]